MYLAIAVGVRYHT